MFCENENKESMLLYFGTANTTEFEFYQKIQRCNKDYRQFDPTDLIPRTFTTAKLWVEDYIKEYVTVVLAGEGFGGFIANVIAHELNLPALVINFVVDIEDLVSSPSNLKNDEVFVNKNNSLLLKPALANSWDVYTLTHNGNFNQKMLDWAVADVCNDKWLSIDYSVLFDKD